MLRIAVIGAGAHSQGNHLPAVQKLCSMWPKRMKAAALCDIDIAAGSSAAETFGFEHFYSGIDQMLEASDYDACIAVTPVGKTAEISKRIAATGTPLLMEKPPGCNIHEARVLAPALAATGTPVMVSLNRRFDPVITAAKDFLRGRETLFIRGTMIRANRTQPDFMYETAIHLVDTVRHLAGDPAAVKSSAISAKSAQWIIADLTFADGVMGSFEIIPTAGAREERYEIFGEGFHINIVLDSDETGSIKVWENSSLVLEKHTDPDEPLFMRNGSYHELLAFLTAIEEHREPRPAPLDALASAEIAAALQSTAESA